MLKTFAYGPTGDGESLIMEWHEDNWVPTFLATVVTWPVFIVMAHITGFIMLLFPDTLPSAKNDFYDDLTSAQELWYALLSFEA
jgi:hypothetical protein